jgi:hypothetical protein
MKRVSYGFKGPLKIGVLKTPEQGGRGLQIKCIDALGCMNLQQQAETFGSYRTDLAAGMMQLTNNDLNRQGVLLIQKLSQQFLPHIENCEPVLNEMIHMKNVQSATVSLQDLLKTHE